MYLTVLGVGIHSGWHFCPLRPCLTAVPGSPKIAPALTSTARVDKHPLGHNMHQQHRRFCPVKPRPKVVLGSSKYSVNCNFSFLTGRALCRA